MSPFLDSVAANTAHPAIASSMFDGATTMPRTIHSACSRSDVSIACRSCCHRGLHIFTLELLMECAILGVQYIAGKNRWMQCGLWCNARFPGVAWPVSASRFRAVSQSVLALTIKTKVCTQPFPPLLQQLAHSIMHRAPAFSTSVQATASNLQRAAHTSVRKWAVWVSEGRAMLWQEKVSPHICRLGGHPVSKGTV